MTSTNFKLVTKIIIITKCNESLRDRSEMRNKNPTWTVSGDHYGQWSSSGLDWTVDGNVPFPTIQTVNRENVRPNYNYCYLIVDLLAGEQVISKQ